MPLNIIVVGAGLGGLGVAIALNRPGHNVQVSMASFSPTRLLLSFRSPLSLLISIQQLLEKSSFLNEVGAAIHVAPNPTRILKAWGCDLDWLRPVHCEKLQIWNSKGDLVRTPIVGFFFLSLLFSSRGLPDIFADDVYSGHERVSRLFGRA
jgi:salicylate hydroxylase